MGHSFLAQVQNKVWRIRNFDLKYDKGLKSQATHTNQLWGVPQHPCLFA